MWMLGLREISDKSSSQTLETFKEISHGIDDNIENPASQQSFGDQILANIRFTMSDRAATCKSFNNLLEDYRLSVLPEVEKIGQL